VGWKKNTFLAAVATGLICFAVFKYSISKEVGNALLRLLLTQQVRTPPTKEIVSNRWYKRKVELDPAFKKQDTE
jgi:hypothetical protein